ncbi:CoA transferase, partial [Cupriavidus sp. CER94]|uniref:CoA transferase n=1 Tax=Cupriavidus sp. CER94 TaxID=3377036 RepID=UPI00380CC7AF
MNAASSATNPSDAAGPGRAAVHQAPADVLAALWSAAAMPPEALSHVTLTGQDPILPSSFAIGTAAQASLGASALAAAAIWAQRTGRWQDVSVDMRHALAEFRSERYLRVNGGPAPELWDKIAGLYPAGDGRWVRLHTNFPHHRDGVLKILKCAYDKDAVRAALSGWKAEDFETVASDAGMVVSAMRSLDEWLRHPQAQALQGLPPVIIEKIGDAPPEPLPAFGPHAEINVDARPLSGVRVLDFTRIIAGPVAGRTLAAHGADVLLVTAAHLPSMPSLVIDTGRGK